MSLGKLLKNLAPIAISAFAGPAIGQGIGQLFGAQSGFSPFLSRALTGAETSKLMGGRSKDAVRLINDVDHRKKVLESFENLDLNPNSPNYIATQIGDMQVYENLVTSIPNFVNITYEFVLWTNFIEQMNPLVEMFIDQSNTYWGDSERYKFNSVIDSVTDASEINQNGERFIKSTFELKVSSYLLTEDINSVVTNKISNMRKVLTPSRVVFGSEFSK